MRLIRHRATGQEGTIVQRIDLRLLHLFYTESVPDCCVYPCHFRAGAALVVMMELVSGRGSA